MQSAQILLLCILGMALLSAAMGNNGNIPEECCFKYYPRKIPKQAIRDYEVTRSDCSKKGVILITKRNYRFCADPDDPLVENIIKFLDQSKF